MFVASSYVRNVCILICVVLHVVLMMNVFVASSYVRNVCIPICVVLHVVLMMNVLRRFWEVLLTDALPLLEADEVTTFILPLNP